MPYNFMDSPGMTSKRRHFDENIFDDYLYDYLARWGIPDMQMEIQRDMKDSVEAEICREVRKALERVRPSILSFGVDDERRMGKEDAREEISDFIDEVLKEYEG